MILLRQLVLEMQQPVLGESKQSIINLGYPEIIAKLFYEKFGRKAYVISKWYREYLNPYNNKDWWENAHSNYRNIDIKDMVDLYYASYDPGKYLKTLERLELSTENFMNDESYLKEQRKSIEKWIREHLFNHTFFTYYSLIIDIVSGKLKDLGPYEKMSFNDAALKYDEKRLFRETRPIKVYDNGFRWINTGKKCNLMAHYMKNCGSAGVMGTDADRTMIGLFDTFDKPHVVVTYSPNEKRISGDEGVASTEVKPEYHEYILDLASVLGAKFDANKTKSKLLKLKYILKDKTKNVKPLKVSKTPSIYDEYFAFDINGKTYYSNGYYTASADDINRTMLKVKSGEIKLRNYQRNKIRDAFNEYNRHILSQHGVRYIPDYELAQLA